MKRVVVHAADVADAVERAEVGEDVVERQVLERDDRWMIRIDVGRRGEPGLAVAHARAAMRRSGRLTLVVGRGR